MDQSLLDTQIGIPRQVHEPVQRGRIQLVTASELGSRTCTERVGTTDEHHVLAHRDHVAVRGREPAVRHRTVQRGDDTRMPVVQLVQAEHAARLGVVGSVPCQRHERRFEELAVSIHAAPQAGLGRGRTERDGCEPPAQHARHLLGSVRLARAWRARQVRVLAASDQFRQHRERCVEDAVLRQLDLGGLDFDLRDQQVQIAITATQFRLKLVQLILRDERLQRGLDHRLTLQVVHLASDPTNDVLHRRRLITAALTLALALAILRLALRLAALTLTLVVAVTLIQLAVTLRGRRRRITLVVVAQHEMEGVAQRQRHPALGQRSHQRIPGCVAQ